jgi:hypothetical protein
MLLWTAQCPTEPEEQHHAGIKQMKISTKQEEIFDQSRVESLETTNITSFVNTNKTPPSAIVLPGKPSVQSLHPPSVVLSDGYRGSHLKPGYRQTGNKRSSNQNFLMMGTDGIAKWEPIESNLFFVADWCSLCPQLWALSALSMSTK